MLLKRHNATQERLDYRAALVCSVVANCNRDPKQKKDPFVPADFMPGKGQTKQIKRRQTPEEQLAIVKLLNAAFGGKVVEG